MSVIGSEADLSSSRASVRSDPYVNATRRLHMGVPEMVTLGLYVGLLIWAFPHHEPWADGETAQQEDRWRIGIELEGSVPELLKGRGAGNIEGKELVEPDVATNADRKDEYV